MDTMHKAITRHKEWYAKLFMIMVMDNYSSNMLGDWSEKLLWVCFGDQKNVKIYRGSAGMFL